MKRLILACSILGALAAPRLAHADDAFDSTGWTKLGEASVDHRHDSDTIDVGLGEGRFAKLMLVVLDADVRIDTLVVTFGNDQTFSATVAQHFIVGSRTRAIDLPGDQRGIKSIELTYGAPGGRHQHRDRATARVQIWGLPAPADSFDSTGWTKLGEASVDGRHDTDTIDVGNADGRFTKLTLVVLDDDLRLDAMLVTFGNDETFAPEVKQYFTEGSRTRAIDLPGDKRGIKSIALTYGNVGKERRHGKHHDDTSARVQIWGMAAADTATTWDSSGWTLLTKTTLRAKSGTVTLKMKRGDVYDHLSLVATGRMHLTGVQVTYTRGPRGSWTVDQDIDEHSPQKQVDIDGGKGRTIRAITIKYQGRQGGRRTGLEVWGRRD